MQNLSLAEQIAQLDQPAPIDFDPEDIHLSAADPDDNDHENVDNTGARDHYLQVGPSALRKLHDSIADPKYNGVMTTRSQLMLENDVDSDSDAQDNLHEVEADSRLTDEQGDGHEEDKDPSQSELDEEQMGKLPGPQEVQQPADDLSSTLRKAKDEDRKKGKAVSRQIAIWDNLLDARIRLQKSVIASNKLPAPSDIPKLTASPEACDALVRLLEESLLLSDELFELQETLLTVNESVQPPPRKKRRRQTGEGREQLADQLIEATEALSALEHSIHPHLLTTITKWSSKIQAVAPSVLLPSSRNAFSKVNIKSAVELIEETLSADGKKLLGRTRVSRGKATRIGEDPSRQEASELDADEEIFDDTDFYQQLLRDVIDARGNGEEDWMIVQREKKKQKKQKIDTKASKGRKLRYEVHEKLQNFMVPISVQKGTWHEEQIDELFASLLGEAGEGFGGNGDENEQVPDHNGTEKVLEEAMKGGFRVFG